MVILMISGKGHNKVWKEKQINEVKSNFDKYSTVAIACVESLPCAIERKYRALLKKDGAFIVNVKNRPVKIFLKDAKLELADKVKGTSVIILSNKSPFELFGMIKKNSGTTSAKVGAVVDIPIEIPAGDTGIAAGPALSDFKALKLDTQIRDGKIFIAKPKVVLEPGQKVDEKTLTILNKLKIKPMTVGMQIIGIYSKTESLLYLPDVLDVDYDDYRNMVAKAYADSTALAIGIHYVSKDTIARLIAKAHREAVAVNPDKNEE